MAFLYYIYVHLELLFHLHHSVYSLSQPQQSLLYLLYKSFRSVQSAISVVSEISVHESRNHHLSQPLLNCTEALLTFHLYQQQIEYLSLYRQSSPNQFLKLLKVSEIVLILFHQLRTFNSSSK